MWDILTGRLGYSVDKVYVLFADGTNPYLDQHDYDTDEYVDSDWSAVSGAGGIIRSATRSDFVSTVQEIGERMVGGKDSFYFWSFDHGGLDFNVDDEPLQGTGYLIGWDMGPVLEIPDTDWYDESIFTSEISSLLAPITSKNPVWEAYIMTQCFAGDFLSGLGIGEADTNRFFAWAADWYESSWGKAFAEAWADGMESGLLLTQDLGDYAVYNDIYGPYQGDHWENPGWIGGNFSIAAIPEPSAIWFGAFAGLAYAGRRRLTLRHRA